MPFPLKHTPVAFVSNAYCYAMPRGGLICSLDPIAFQIKLVDAEAVARGAQCARQIFHDPLAPTAQAAASTEHNAGSELYCAWSNVLKLIASVRNAVLSWT